MPRFWLGISGSTVIFLSPRAGVLVWSTGRPADSAISLTGESLEYEPEKAELASRDVVYEGLPGSARSGAVGEAKR